VVKCSGSHLLKPAPLPASVINCVFIWPTAELFSPQLPNHFTPTNNILFLS
jgi:hypothetical protein